jgi:hypothetical protein
MMEPNHTQIATLYADLMEEAKARMALLDVRYIEAAGQKVQYICALSSSDHGGCAAVTWSLMP